MISGQNDKTLFKNKNHFMLFWRKRSGQLNFSELFLSLGVDFCSLSVHEGEIGENCLAYGHRQSWPGARAI